jgi:single-strand DNA-binding protein
MSLNKIMLIGRVGGDPQVRTVGENKVANFTLATTEKFKDREETEWHNIAVWGKQAETIEKYVEKGMMLYVEGRIKTEKYNKDGQERETKRIQASTFQMLSKKEGASAPQSRPQSTPLPTTDFADPSDDLPF